MNGPGGNIEQVTPLTIRSFLQKEEASIRDAHFNGAGGNEVVQRRTAIYDRALQGLHAAVAGEEPLPALVAVGGYGRGELNPFSDIDILFLCRDDAERQRAPELLYALWDAGLDIGYSVRTIPDCTALAREDIKVRTSLIESRLLAGDRSFYESFQQAMTNEVFYWKPGDFITQKLSERQAVRQKFGGSIYLREPNIKESPGGLRDIHTALWIAAVHFRIRSFPELVRSGIITPGQEAVFLRSRSFLWRLRNELHYVSGRKNDHLTFDLQERAAKDFRYRDSANLFAVERFMKSYFIHARNIREFSALVMDNALRRPERKRWYERSVRVGKFIQMGKTLIPSGDGIFRDEPELLSTAFRIMQSRHLSCSDRLKALISEQRFGEEVRKSPRTSGDFIAILDTFEGLTETLTLMRDLRFLGRYLPEFRSIQHLARHDHYHKYTVDEHILTALRGLQDLRFGRYQALESQRQAFNGLKKRWVLVLAVLLHDLGKAYREDHDRRSAEIASGVLDRLAVHGEDRERVLFLVQHHQAMSILSQRRELGDAKVIADFARLVGDRQNLDMLYLLTYADIAAVNPAAWTQWRASLLQDLYLRTVDYLERKTARAEDERARLEAAKQRLRRHAEGHFSPEDVEAFIAVLPEKYLLTAPLQKVMDHMDMMRRLPEEGIVLHHRHNIDRGYTELTICAYDAYGMFYRAAGTLSSKNLNILRAQIFTTKNGIMLDTFHITDAEGNPYLYEETWWSVEEELRESLWKKKRPPEPGTSAPSRSALPLVEPTVNFDNESSDQFTIIDITARDRIGLLYGITRTLYDLNVDIASAKINTEGEKVIDAFYVADLIGEKITDPGRLERTRKALLEVLR